MKYYVHFISFSFQYYRYHFETVRLGYPYSCNASYILFISSFFMICEFALVCFLLILLWQCALLCDEFRPYFALPTLFIVTIIFLGRFPLSGLTLLRWSHFSIWLKIGSCHAVQLFSGNSRAVVDFKHESQQRGKGVVIFASPSPSPPPTHTHTRPSTTLLIGLFTLANLPVLLIIIINFIYIAFISLTVLGALQKM